MPLPYTGAHGELNFEADFIALLQQSGWEKKKIKNYTVKDFRVIGSSINLENF